MTGSASLRQQLHNTPHDLEARIATGNAALLEATTDLASQIDAHNQRLEEMQTIGISSSASDQHARFVDRLTRANRQLQLYSEQKDGATVGSTIAALLAYEGQYTCLWMGDSRVYLIRRGKLRQVSRDHSEVQELVEQGVLSKEEARNWPRRNVITRAVGVSPDINLEVAYGAMEDNDTYLLCSDGLTAHNTDEDILEAVNGRRKMGTRNSTLSRPDCQITRAATAFMTAKNR